jgi:predicted kinase
MTKADRILGKLSLPDRRWQQSCLIATFGFPGAGKTTIASNLSERYPSVCLTTDSIRLEYGFTSGPETLKAMCLVAGKLLKQGYSIIFDGIHMMRTNRETFRHFGAAHNAHVRFIHVVADPTVIQQRLDLRAENVEATTQAGKFVITDEHFQRIISYYESPDGEHDVFEVDTSSPTLPPENQLASLYAELDTWFLDKGQD